MNTCNCGFCKDGVLLVNDSFIDCPNLTDEAAPAVLNGGGLKFLADAIADAMGQKAEKEGDDFRVDHDRSSLWIRSTPKGPELDGTAPESVKEKIRALAKEAGAKSYLRYR